MQKILAKLLEVQKQMKPILKDSRNPHFKNTYFDINDLIATLKPIFNSLGIVAIQPLVMWDSKPALQTRLIDSESGEEVQSIITLPEASDAPKTGAAITYYRRYALTSLLCIEGEDEDGEVPKKVSKLTPFEAARQAVIECPHLPGALGALETKIKSSTALDIHERTMLLALVHSLMV